jgi:hypothetical protein
MKGSESIRALRGANPRTRAGFTESVEAAAEAVRAQLVSVPAPAVVTKLGGSRTPRRRLVRVSAAAATLAVGAGAALSLTIGSLGGGAGVQTATAAVQKAATATAASAEHSGTVAVRMTHNGQPWAAKTVRWNGADVAIVEDGQPGARPARELRVVDGTLYGPDERGGWLALGTPANIDPESGTTPAEHLAAVREDIGGLTLRRFTGGVTGLTSGRLADGSTVYRGTVAAGLIARETGLKEGRSIRVLPFGYVAHDEAANPSAPLDVTVTVGADGIVREIAVFWGTSDSAWTYTVTYTGIGTTTAPVAPANARSLEDLRRSAALRARAASGN